MKTQQANKKLDAIIADIEENGISIDTIDELKALRDLALKEDDPLITKVLRLTYEYIEENDAFDVEAQYEEDDEGNQYPIELDDEENLIYLLNLLKSSEHKINREEIKDYRTALKEELY